MKATELKSEGLKREYKIVVEGAEIEATTETRLKNMGSKVKIPGFRPGHVPMKVLKQRYGNSVMGEVIETAIRNASQEAMKQNKLRPALQPKIQVTDFKEGGNLEFTMELEIFPELPTFEFEKIKLDKITFDLDEAEVTQAVENLAQRNKTSSPLADGKKAALGHVVKIDFKGSIKGVPFDGGEAKKYHLELGSGQFIPGFEDQLIGVKKGEDKVVNVAFPKDYHKADLAGQDAQFAVHVHEILEPVAPEINDEFAKRLGMESLDKLKDAVRDRLRQDYQGAARNKMKKQLFDYLEENYVFPVPEGMVTLEFDSIWERLQQAKKEGDPSLNKPDEELRKEYQRIAERRVRLGIILADVGNQHKITVTKEELSQAVLEQARMFPGQERKVFEFYQKNPAQIEDLRGPILEDKAVDFLFGKVKTTEKKLSLAELLDQEEGEADAEPKKKSAKAKEKSEGEAKPKAKKKAE